MSFSGSSLFSFSSSSTRCGGSPSLKFKSKMVGSGISSLPDTSSLSPVSVTSSPGKCDCSSASES
eukprot:scaffold122559_cov58-Attheya_sp.AAC.5